MKKLKVEDNVIVIAGKEKGKTGKLVNINYKTNKVLVEGVNIVKRSVKKSEQNPAGGYVDKILPLHISNVALVSPKTGKATRVKIIKNDGKTSRECVSCNTIL